MLKIGFLALLGIGCVMGAFQAQVYSNRAFEEYERDGSDEEYKFPRINFIRPNWSFNFLPESNGISGLTFQGKQGTDIPFFEAGEEVFRLVSLTFRFIGDHEVKLYLEFKSRSKKWTVISRMFTPNPEESIDRDARERAVRETSLTHNFATSLHDSRFRKDEVQTINIEWVKNVLKDQRPKLSIRHENTVREKHFVSVPVIAEYGALEALNNLRMDLLPLYD